MNALAKQQGQLAPQGSYEAIIQELPVWLGYMVGAYPSAYINPMTFPVFEDQFSSYDSQVLLQAARNWVGAENGHFPYAPAQFRPYVDALAEPDYHKDFIRRMGRIGWALVDDNGEGVMNFEKTGPGQLPIYY